MQAWHDFCQHLDQDRGQQNKDDRERESLISSLKLLDPAVPESPPTGSLEPVHPLFS